MKNNTGDEQFTPDGSMEPLSPWEADTHRLRPDGHRRTHPAQGPAAGDARVLSGVCPLRDRRARPAGRARRYEAVHRRVIYAMYDGGYPLIAATTECSRVVGDVMGKYHPHGDSAIYDTLVRMAQSWSMRNMLVDGQGNFGPRRRPRPLHHALHRMPYGPAGHGNGARHRQGHRRLRAQLRRARPRSRPCCRPASRTCSSTAPPASPSAWPPTSRRTTCARWRTASTGRSTPDASREGTAGKPDPHHQGDRTSPPAPPSSATRGIEQAYRTGRGLITMRAVVNTEEINGRMCLVVTELPYQVNPDRLVVVSIREAVRDGKDPGHRRHARRDLRPYRPAPRARAQARRRAEGGPEQPVQSTPSCSRPSAPTCWRWSTACRAR